MAYYTRKHWTTVPNKAVAVKRQQVHATLHYPGFGDKRIRTAGWDRDRCFRQLRAWRNMHVGSGAYKEVAYNLYALPTGDVVEGRGNRQNGANGTSTANRAGMSVQVLIGDDEPLTAGHLKAIFEAFALLERWHPGITNRQYPHSHWVSTSCPGPHVRAGIPFRASQVPIDGGGGGITGNPPNLSGGFADVDDTQLWLNELGFDAGVVDGSYGPKTEAATRAAQQYLGITPADGRPGPATRTILEDAVTKLDEISKKLDALPKLVWGIGGGPHAPMISRRFEKGSEYPETTLGSMTDRIIRQQIVPLRGEVAGLAKAVEQIGKGEPVDLDAVRAAARAGVADALGDVRADVQVTVKGD